MIYRTDICGLTPFYAANKDTETNNDTNDGANNAIIVTYAYDLNSTTIGILKDNGKVN